MFRWKKQEKNVNVSVLVLASLELWGLPAMLWAKQTSGLSDYMWLQGVINHNQGVT